MKKVTYSSLLPSTPRRSASFPPANLPPFRPSRLHTTATARPTQRLAPLYQNRLSISSLQKRYRRTTDKPPTTRPRFMDTATPAAITIGVSLEPPYMRSGSTGAYPNVGLSASFTYPSEQLPRPPAPNWTGCPQFYLEARQEDPLFAFLLDPLMRGTYVWSSNDWPAAPASPIVQPQTAPWLPDPQFRPKFPPGHRSLDFTVDFPFPRPGSLQIDPTFRFTFTSDYPAGRRLFSSPATPSPAVQPQAAPRLPDHPFPAPVGTGYLHPFLEAWQRRSAPLTDPIVTYKLAPSSSSFPDAPLSRRLWSRDNLAVDASLGPSPTWSDSRPLSSGVGLSFSVEYGPSSPASPAVQPQATSWSAMRRLWSRHWPDHLSFDVTPRPSPERLGMRHPFPTLGASLSYGDPWGPRPAPDWTGCPQFYLKARQEDPFVSFLLDPIALKTLTWSSDDWLYYTPSPSSLVQPQAAPGLPDRPSEHPLPSPAPSHAIRPPRRPFWTDHREWLYSDGPFPGEPGYAEWKASHPEEAALLSDPRVVSRADDLQRYIRRVAADRWSCPPRPFGEETPPPISRRYLIHPRPLTGEELRLHRFTKWAAVVRRAHPPTRRYSLYTTRQLARGRISSQPTEPSAAPAKQRPFPGELGYPEWKAAHPKEAALLSIQRLPRPPRRRYSPFWGRSRLEIDWRRMKVRFVHEAFWNRRPIKDWTELQRASRTAKALLRRRHRPSPGAFEEAPAKQVEYFLPIIGTILLTVPPTVLYFVNDYKTVLPFAANYDPEGLRYTYDHLKGRLKLPNQIYFMFVGSSALDEVTGECEQARDWAWEWYKRTYLPLFIPKNTRARYSREKDAAEAAERERLLILRAKRIHLTRWQFRLPAFLYNALQQRFTPTPPLQVVQAYISAEVPEVPATLPWYFPLLQWWLPYWHWLHPPSAPYVAAHGLYPDYDYEYPAGDLVLHVDEKGRKFVEISEEALADADDPKDTEQLEEEARRDAEEKEKLFGPL